MGDAAERAKADGDPPPVASLSVDLGRWRRTMAPRRSPEGLACAALIFALPGLPMPPGVGAPIG